MNGTASRICGIGAGFLFACISLSAHADVQLKPYEQRAREIYQELVEVNTVTETGDTARAADAMAARLIAAGFPREDVQVFKPAPNKGNVVARYRGTGKLKPMILMAHIDVVEARREDWSTDPFKLIEKDGYFYGRGTGDDKFMAVAFVANLVRYRAEKWQPDRDLILVLETDEESLDQGVVGAQWLLKNHRNLLDAEFALNEGGGVGSRNGKVLRVGVQTSEKVPANYILEVRNRGGHSSLPRKDNAIYTLAEGLSRLGKYEFPIKLNETTRVWLERSAPLESPQVGTDMKALAAGKADAAAIARLSADPSINSILRTTCVATLLEGGHAMNALPQLARATVNCRVLPGEPLEEVRKAIAKAVGDEQIAVTQSWGHVASDPSPLNPKIMGTIEQLAQKHWPGVPVIPSMSAGATDGSFLRNAGIPTYGYSALVADIDDVRAHGRDERVEVKSFYEGLEHLYQLVKALASR
jgi:acetylornithine deacetylase/succinyl-diaminopimelate desuccinylase-like protein